MADTHIKNNLARNYGGSGTNGKCASDKQNNAGSFSDLCSHHKSAVLNTYTVMDVKTKCTNKKQSDSTVTLNTDTSHRYKKHNLNIPNTSHPNPTNLLRFSIRTSEVLEIKRMNYFVAYMRIHLTYYVYLNIIYSIVS
jgi:hypothetical protein